MPKYHFAIDLDDWAQESHKHLSTNQDGVAGHYARYTTETKAQAVDAIMEKLRPLVEKMVYPSDSYGYMLGAGETNEESDNA